MTVAWARPGAVDEARRAELLVLDIDGVLLDPRPSFYEAARLTSSWAADLLLGHASGEAVTDNEIGVFKTVGGWNDDFDLACGMTWALVARSLAPARPSVSETASQVSGGLSSLERHLRALLGADRFSALSERCPTSLIRGRSAAHYSGLERCREMYGLEPRDHDGVSHRGLWSTEPVLCDARLLNSAPVPLAFFTGRNAAEAGIAVERLELSIAPALRSIDDGISPRKPAPDGLLRLAHGRTQPLIFVGDSIDDQRAALSFRASSASRSGPGIVFARVVGPDASAAEVERARSDGADFVVHSLDALLAEVWKEMAP